MTTTKSDRQFIESITTADLTDFATEFKNNWVRYASVSSLKLRLEFNAQGAFRVVKDGFVVWVGTDAETAVQQFKEA